MRDLTSVAFLVVANAIVLALLVTMLGGCVATPSRYQDRNGDFATHIAGAGELTFSVSDSQIAQTIDTGWARLFQASGSRWYHPREVIMLKESEYEEISCYVSCACLGN